MIAILIIVLVVVLVGWFYSVKWLRGEIKANAEAYTMWNLAANKELKRLRSKNKSKE